MRSAAFVSGMLLASCALLGAAPVICDDVAPDPCHAAHAVALAEGLFIDSSDRISSVAVAPTPASYCDPDTLPSYDVTFQLQGHADPVVVTVGESDDGRLVPCTY